MRLMTQDRWAALVCLAFALLVIVTMPGQTSDRPIPGARGFDLLDGAFFPKIAVAIFIVAAVWLFVAGRPKAEAKPPATSASGAAPADEQVRFVVEAEDEPPGLTLGNFLYACALTLGVLAYVQLLGWAGYLLSTILAVAVLALICGQRSWLGLVIGAVLFPVVVYYIFAVGFLVPLPRAELW